MNRIFGSALLGNYCEFAKKRACQILFPPFHRLPPSASKRDLSATDCLFSCLFFCESECRQPFFPPLHAAAAAVGLFLERSLGSFPRSSQKIATQTRRQALFRSSKSKKREGGEKNDRLLSRRPFLYWHADCGASPFLFFFFFFFPLDPRFSQELQENSRAFPHEKEKGKKEEKCVS